jgi:hypothetical protein
LKRAVYLPVSVETYRAVQLLEEEIQALRLALLRQDPDQLELPMEVANEGPPQAHES